MKSGTFSWHAFDREETVMPSILADGDADPAGIEGKGYILHKMTCNVG